MRSLLIRWKSLGCFSCVAVLSLLIFNEYATRIHPFSFTLNDGEKSECFSGEFIRPTGAFRNRTLLPIKVLQTHTLCGCTTSDFINSQDGQWILPGSTLPIAFSINTQGKYSVVDFGGAIEAVDVFGRKILFAFELPIQIDQPWIVSKAGFRSDHAGSRYDVSDEFYLLSDSERSHTLEPTLSFEGDGTVESEYRKELPPAEVSAILAEMEDQFGLTEIKLLGKVRFRWHGALGVSESTGKIHLKLPTLPDVTGATVKLTARRHFGSFLLHPNSISHRIDRSSSTDYFITIVANGSESIQSLDVDSRHQWLKPQAIEMTSANRWRLPIRITGDSPTGAHLVDVLVNGDRYRLPLAVNIIN